MSTVIVILALAALVYVVAQAIRLDGYGHTAPPRSHQRDRDPWTGLPAA